MKAEGWANGIRLAVYQADRGDTQGLDLLAKSLEEMDRAKQELLEAGFGMTGMSLLERVRDVLREVKRGP